MNLPNRITLLRVILIPAFLFIYLAQPFGEIANAWIALVFFVIAALTDALDGYLARKLGQVTNFGKLMDPLADKLLVCSALIAFTATGSLPAWAVIVLISREFYISGLRQLALEQKIVVAASFSAKLKTISQIVLIIYFLLPYPFTFFFHEYIALGLIIITTIISVYSAAEYTLENKTIFNS
ncbi:MAG: CDP-diacylglycerol--glycerol-3-phosphate 3-phosphatidyltransferase [Clostridiales bacterium]|nr:CDP-diacylglycerol--glycerol-3-phosphate 3-phosphatidyltransferase [Clostridiales bacterium]